ncbi:hypothetical protein [Bacteroides sp.]|uniref:hypothetical protein n=1 Tax=Bacteroides sp. TaxID=29523 RepID=UPI0026252F75|nr:hypothetical protein [Bacteroides sp.]MDD3038313.1 hypothetical protein [Bacteroides sp.]
MKKLKFTLFLVGILVALVACEQNYDFVSDSEGLEANEKSISELKMRSALEAKALYMPLDTVPEWVKKKVTLEEYELWKIMSSKYEINYSVLEEELSQRQKDSVYSIIRPLVQNIKDGKTKNNAGYFIIHDLAKSINTCKVERLSNGESDNQRNHVGGPSRLYSVSSNIDAEVLVTIIYCVDVKKREIISVESPHAFASGLQAVSFNGDCTANKGTTAIVVEGSGTLTYYVTQNENKKIVKFYNKSVTIGAIF